MQLQPDAEPVRRVGRHRANDDTRQAWLRRRASAAGCDGEGASEFVEAALAAWRDRVIRAAWDQRQVPGLGASGSSGGAINSVNGERALGLATTAPDDSRRSGLGRLLPPPPVASMHAATTPFSLNSTAGMVTV